MSFLLTRRAHCDVVEIGDFIALDDSRAAERMIAAIEEKCALLGRNAGLGPPRPDLAPELRYVVAGNYLVLYRAITGGVEIVRVLHGARTVARLLR